MRADLVGKRLAERRAPDHDFDPIAQPALAQHIDGASHVGHRGCEECGQRDDLRLVRLRRLDELLRCDIHAQIDDDEPGSLQHHPDQVLADIVQVALHRAEHHRALAASLARFLEQRLQHGHPVLHGGAGHHELRQEELAILVQLPDLLHARGHALQHDIQWAQAAVQSALDGCGKTRTVELEQAVLQVFQCGTLFVAQVGPRRRRRGLAALATATTRAGS